MFAARFYPNRFFAGRYFPHAGGSVAPPAPAPGLYLFRRVRDGAALAFRTV
jgi:hypothetical protein